MDPSFLFVSMFIVQRNLQLLLCELFRMNMRREKKYISGSQPEAPFSFSVGCRQKAHFSKIDENVTPSFRQLSLQNSYVMAGGGPVGLQVSLSGK